MMEYVRRALTANLYLLLLLAIVALDGTPARGGPISFSFSSGTRSAQVDFVRSGSNLIVTLANTSTSDAMVPTDILTGVFFNISGNPSLTRTSAVVPLTSSVVEIGTGTNVTPGDRVVGGEWAYRNSLSVGGNNQGISSSGLGLFGPGDLFPGIDLVSPTSPAGINLGITSAGDNVLTGNGGISGQWLTKNANVFALGGYTGEPSADIGLVRFQYGTALTEFSIEVVPEPGSIILCLAGMALGAYWCRWRRRHAR